MSLWQPASLGNAASGVVAAHTRTPLLAIGGQDGVLTVLEVLEEDTRVAFQQPLATPAAAVTRIQWQTARAAVAVGHANGHVALWAHRRKPRARPDQPAVVRDTRALAAPVVALAWAPDDTVLAASDETGRLALWTVERGRKLQLAASFELHSDVIHLAPWTSANGAGGALVATRDGKLHSCELSGRSGAALPLGSPVVALRTGTANAVTCLTADGTLKSLVRRPSSTGSGTQRAASVEWIAETSVRLPLPSSSVTPPVALSNGSVVFVRTDGRVCVASDGGETSQIALDPPGDETVTAVAVDDQTGAAAVGTADSRLLVQRGAAIADLGRVFRAGRIARVAWVGARAVAVGLDATGPVALLCERPQCVTACGPLALLQRGPQTVRLVSNALETALGDADSRTLDASVPITGILSMALSSTLHVAALTPDSVTVLLLPSAGKVAAAARQIASVRPPPASADLLAIDALALYCGFENRVHIYTTQGVLRTTVTSGKGPLRALGVGGRMLVAVGGVPLTAHAFSLVEDTPALILSSLLPAEGNGACRVRVNSDGTLAAIIVGGELYVWRLSDGVLLPSGSPPCGAWSRAVWDATVPTALAVEYGDQVGQLADDPSPGTLDKATELSTATLNEPPPAAEDSPESKVTKLQVVALLVGPKGLARLKPPPSPQCQLGQLVSMQLPCLLYATGTAAADDGDLAALVLPQYGSLEALGPRDGLTVAGPPNLQRLWRWAAEEHRTAELAATTATLTRCIELAARCELSKATTAVDMADIDQALKALSGPVRAVFAIDAARTLADTPEMTLAKEAQTRAFIDRAASASLLARLRSLTAAVPHGPTATQLALGLVERALETATQHSPETLCALLCAQGDEIKALAVANARCRIEWRHVFYQLGQRLQDSDDVNGAVSALERTTAPAATIPALLLRAGGPERLQAYIDSSDKSAASLKMKQWYAHWLESKDRGAEALAAYAAADDALGQTRLLSAKGRDADAAALANADDSAEARFYLAQTYEARGDAERAIAAYSQLGFFEQAMRVARTFSRDAELAQLALQAKHPAALRAAARYFESRGDVKSITRAVSLYDRAGDPTRAMALCFAHRLPKQLAAVAENADAGRVDSELLDRCARFFASNGQLDKAVRMLLVAERDATPALQFAVDHAAQMSDELADMLLERVNDSLAAAAAPLLRQLAELAVRQRQYAAASRVFLRLGDHRAAFEALLRTGDADRIAAVANAAGARNPDILVLAANFLQSQLAGQALEAKSAAKLNRTIVHFYGKAHAYAHLARYHISSAQRAISQHRDYDAALGLLGEAAAAARRDGSDGNLAAQCDAHVSAVRKLLGIAKTASADPRAAVADGERLLSELGSASGSPVRRGDILALMVTACVHADESNAASALLGRMRAELGPAAALHEYLSEDILSSLALAGGPDRSESRASRRSNDAVPSEDLASLPDDSGF